MAENESNLPINPEMAREIVLKNLEIATREYAQKLLSGKDFKEIDDEERHKHGLPTDDEISSNN